MMAPAVMFLIYTPMQWLERHRQQQPFGEMIAENILVQTPLFMVQCVGHVLIWITVCFAFIDLNFSIGPIIFFGVIALLELVTMAWLQRYFEAIDRRDRRQGEVPTTEILEGNLNELQMGTFNPTDLDVIPNISATQRDSNPNSDQQWNEAEQGYAMHNRSALERIMSSAQRLTQPKPAERIMSSAQRLSKPESHVTSI